MKKRLMTPKKIDAKFIRTLHPCKEAVDSFEKHCPKFKGKLSELMALENVPFYDKVSIARKTIPLKTYQQWAIECAASAAYVYREKYPYDSVIDVCIQACKDYLDKKITKKELTDIRSDAMTASGKAYYTHPTYAAFAATDAAASCMELTNYYSESAIHYAHSAVCDHGDHADLNISILVALLDNEGL